MVTWRYIVERKAQGDAPTLSATASKLLVSLTDTAARRTVHGSVAALLETLHWGMPDGLARGTPVGTGLPNLGVPVNFHVKRWMRGDRSDPHPPLLTGLA